MKRKKFMVIKTVILMLLIPSFLSAKFGPGVSELDGKKLKWEEGARDVFVMFKSIIKNDNLADDPPGNPQADTCIDKTIGSTYKLTSKQIPEDAHIEAAYLVWTSAMPEANLMGQADNEVTLTFTNAADSSVTHSEKITGPSATVNDDFGFEFQGYTDGVVAPYTYRQDITGFMNEVHKKGREADIGYDGITLYGDYNVKDLDCTNDPAYLDTTIMVGGWAIILVYSSSQIRPKKIYMYNDFTEYQDASEDINVSGFELPDEAEVRLALHVLEGDPGLYNGWQFSNTEAVKISGANNPDWALIFNDCNPLMNDGAYVEVYNSISSVFNWGSDTPECVGGDPHNPDPNQLEYGMDVDTFYINAIDSPFDQHLKPGDDNLWIQISANQDLIYTNFLILSIDTKKPAFDIPNEREKWGCSCAEDWDEDFICEDKPFWYLIKVQNWGEVVTNNVKVKDELPGNVKYVPGTAEYATKLDSSGKKGTNWQSVPDSESGDPFPFSNPRQVAESMEKCDMNTGECEDTVLIRFLVEPQNLSKNSVVSNMAEIEEASGLVYKTNTSIPLRLNVASTCPPNAECEIPSKERCGGINLDPECETDDDCEEGYSCDENSQCVKEEEGETELSENAEISIGEGSNTPVSESPIIVPNNSENITGGQFYILSASEKQFNFNGLMLKFEKSNGVNIENIRIVEDTNGNGVFDEGEKVAGTGTEISSSGYSEITIKEESRILNGETKHNFLIIYDASYSGGSMPDDTYFYALIENSEAVNVSDTGEPSVSIEGANEIEFAEYMFEPEEGFIVTMGENNPAITDPSVLNSGKINIWQIKTKSIKGGDTLKNIRINTYSNQYVSFGDKIKGLELFHDANGNGRYDQGEQKLGTPQMTENAYTFNNVDLSYNEGEIKNLLVRAEFNLERGEAAKFRIPENGVNIEGTSSGLIYGLPVSSQELLYDCDPEDEDCGFSSEEKKDDGCSCSFVATGKSPSKTLPALLLLIFSGIAIFVLKTKKSS
ncbi:MAG: hypothetical protein R6W70_03170 [bacterium]